MVLKFTKAVLLLGADLVCIVYSVCVRRCRIIFRKTHLGPTNCPLRSLAAQVHSMVRVSCYAQVIYIMFTVIKAAFQLVSLQYRLYLRHESPRSSSAASRGTQSYERSEPISTHWWTATVEHPPTYIQLAIYPRSTRNESEATMKTSMIQWN